MRWARRLFTVIAACVLLSACRIDGTVNVDVNDDGSGVVRVTVAFDADAVARIPDLASTLRFDDLTASGWTVTPPAKQPDGRTLVRAEKPFEAPNRLTVVLSEVSGAFRNTKLERTRSFGRKQWDFTGTVDLSPGAALFSDDQVTALLGGRPLGRDVATIEQETGAKIADSTALALTVTLPGTVSGNANQIEGHTGSWSFRLDQATPASLALRGTTQQRAAVIWGGVGLGAAALFVLVMLIRIVRRGGRRGARAVQTVTPVFMPAPPPRRLELVIVDANGVLWGGDRSDDERLVAFVANHGGTATTQAVRSALTDAIVGRLTSAQLWTALGVDGNAAQLDEEYTASFELAPNVVEFVAAMARRGVGVACVTNDVAEWSALLRRRFGLETLIRPWVASGDAGVCKPDALIYEQVAARAGVAMSNCLFIDDKVDHLDMARRLGMSTVRFDASGDARAAPPHRTITGFADLLGRTADAAPS